MKDLEELYSGDLDDLNRYYQITADCSQISFYLLDYQMSIRQVAKETGMSKSKIHQYIHTYIREYYDEDYVQIKRLLKYNKKYRAMPRKYWKGRCW